MHTNTHTPTHTHTHTNTHKNTRPRPQTHTHTPTHPHTHTHALWSLAVGFDGAHGHMGTSPLSSHMLPGLLEFIAILSHPRNLAGGQTAHICLSSPRSSFSPSLPRPLQSIS